MLSWPVLMKFKQMLDQGNMLVFALTVRWLLKLFRPPKRLHWYECQKVLNDISNWAHCGAVWVPGHAGVQRNDIANKIRRDSSVQKFVGPELSLGVSRLNIRRKLIHWLDNQHLARW